MSLTEDSEVVCDPEIEDCSSLEKTTAERPDSAPALYIGIIAVLKSLIPLLLKLTASDDSAKMTAIWNPGAGLLWWLGNFLVWFPLMVMWPLTNSGTLVDIYLLLTLNLGLYGGAVLALINALSFVSAMGKDSKAGFYLAIVALIDIPGVIITWLFFSDAEAYLTWVEPVEIVKIEEVEPEPEPIEPPEPEPLPEPEPVPEPEPIIETEPEPVPEPIPEPEPEPEIIDPFTDDSPFVDFHTFIVL